MKKFLFIFTFCIFLSQLLFSQLKPGQLRVDGRYLKDGSGNTVRLIGINHAHAWYRGYLGSALQGIRSWGANSVRVVLSNGYKWTKIPASEVSTIISQARSYGFKAIVLEVHDTTGYGDDSSACTLDRAVDYWIEIKSVLDGQEDFVIINIGNEPIGNNSSYVSQWANWTKSAIQRLRNNGFTHVIMVDAPNWGQDWTNTMRNNASDVLNADSLRNTIFSVHMYGVYNTASKVQSYISYFYNNNLPLCIGEFGNYHTDGDPDEQAIVQYAKQYGYSIFGWSWCGNGGGVEYLDMVYNWDANSPTNWGSWYKTNALSDVQTYYTLTVNVSPQGSGSVSLNPPGGSYTAGTQVTLTAQANSGWVFSSWSGSLTGSQNPATIVMDSSKTVTANFVRSSYTLTVNINPSGAGSVTLNPSGGVYVAGTTVTLTAVASSGWVFSSWSGSLTGSQNPATIVMNSSKTVTANFVRSSYTLTVNINPSGAGSVTLNPSGGVYVAGTTVTLTAVASSGWVFSGWSGSLTGSQNPATIVMNSSKTVTANFVQQSTTTQQPHRYTLTIDINPQFGGIVELNPQGGEYVAGTTVTITAVANSGWVFSGWGGDLSGNENPAVIVMNSSKTVIANFIQQSSTTESGVGNGGSGGGEDGGNVGGGVGGEGGGSGGSSGDVSGREINSKTNKLYINLTNKQTETILVNKTEVEWIKVYDLKGKLIDSYDGDILDVKRYKVGSYIFELKLKDGRTKYGTMVVVK
jgi:NOL1/NOP2/fmu family ribosome biogenesis protein